jgi:RNA polymerase sigma-70 factor (ECF subfamily)
MLCAYSNRFVCLEDAEDIVQDTMVWLWENRELIEIESSLNSYLFKTVYNRTINKIIKNESQQRAEQLFYKKLQDMYIDVDYYLAEELIIHIEKAVTSLPASYSEAFTMHRFAGLSYKEIALQLNISVKTVDYRIQQALKLLRKELIDHL